jgi:hypothetical protein
MIKNHKLTALVIGSHDEFIHQNAFPLIRNKLELLLTRTSSFLHTNNSSSHWSLRVISGNANDIDAVCRDVCESNQILYDLLCLNTLATDVISAEKIVIYPDCNRSSANTRKKIRATRNELGISFSDMVLLVTNVDLEKNENLELFEVAKDALLFGRLVIFLDSSTTLKVIDPKNLPTSELTVLSQGFLDDNFLKSYAKNYDFDSISSALDHLNLFSHDQSYLKANYEDFLGDWMHY